MLIRGITITIAAIRHCKRHRLYASVLLAWAISASSGTPEYYPH